MAHHNSTPKSVLDAPNLTVKVIVEHTAMSRAQRRHGFTSNGKRFNIPKVQQAPAFNEPYRKPLHNSAA